MALTLRKDKGSKLSIKELDDNFTYLDNKTNLDKAYKVYSSIINQVITEQKTSPVKPGEKFIIGKTYFISTLAKGDDFTNIGASQNLTGTYFIATGESPNSWSKSEIIYDNAPVITELENTLGVDLYWKYKDVGQYILNSYTPIFFDNKTPKLNYLNIEEEVVKTLTLKRISDTEVLLSQTTIIDNTFTYVDDIIDAFIELRVYNGGTASVVA